MYHLVFIVAVGGRRGLSVPAFLLHRKLRNLDAAVLQCLVTDMDQIGGRRVQAVPAFYHPAIV